MPEPVIKPPTVKQQSWGTIVSIVLIVLMIMVGAFYAWGKRIAEEQQYQNSFATGTSTTASSTAP
jgi:Kef-type K+ transport system membrane component KefB